MNPETYSTLFPHSFSPDPCNFAGSDHFSIFPSPASAYPTSLPPSSDFPIDSSLFLPSLCSLEHGDSSAPKRLRLLSPPAAASKHPADSARTRRHKFGDRTRSLQKLLPWTKKMDTATVLEDAAKYVRFLHSQVAVLQAMPISSSFGPMTFDGSSSASAIVGPLGTLNRQQTLQVLVNSPVAQTRLSDLGLCVFSYEQLVMLRKVPAALPHPFNNFNH